MAGQSIHQILEEGNPVSPGTVLRIGVHLAHQLADAHRRGKTFGGVYPDQVLVNPEGQVTILELAATRLPEDLTLSYLCFCPPEILENAAPTAASDIYSLGVILYSLLTGYVPFTAGSREGLAQEILESRMQPLPNLTGEFSQFNWILRKCMLKVPQRRFATADEVATELRRIGGTGSVAKKVALSTPVIQARKIQRKALDFRSLDYRALLADWRILAGLAGVLLILVASLVLIFSGPDDEPAWRKVEHWDIKAIISDPDRELQPALSPDGTLLSYVSNRTGNFELFVRKPGSESAVQVSQSPGYEERPRWSPDGTLILYTYRHFQSPPGVFAVSPAGGIPQKIADDAMDGAWSPDGKLVCYVTPASQEVRNLVVRDSISTETRVVLENQKGLAGPSFSYNGEDLVVSVEKDGHSVLILVDADSGRTRDLITEGDTHDPFWDWKTGAIYFTRTDRGSAIWRTDSKGNAEPVTDGSEIDSYPAASFAGMPVVFQREQILYDIYQTDPETGITRNDSPEIGQSYRPICISEAGSLVYTAPARNGNTLKMFIRGGTAPATVVPMFPPDALVTVSPDGASVYVEYSDSARPGIWQIVLSDGREVQVGASLSFPYEFSPDQRSLLYGKPSGNEVFYLRRNLKTQEEEELFHLPRQDRIVRAVWVDQSSIVYRTARGGASLFNLRTKSASPLIEKGCIDMALKPHSNELAVLTENEISLIDLRSGEKQSLAEFSSEAYARHLDWARDGTVLFYDRYKTNSDIFQATGR